MPLTFYRLLSTLGYVHYPCLQDYAHLTDFLAQNLFRK
jgi:hypothetical protein